MNRTKGTSGTFADCGLAYTDSSGGTGIDISPSGSGLYLAVSIAFIAGLAFGQSPGAQESAVGAIQGTVKDASGSAVPGAVVTFETGAPTTQHTAITDQAGSFRFSALSGKYKVTIAALGFAVWTAENGAVGAG